MLRPLTNIGDERKARVFEIIYDYAEIMSIIVQMGVDPMNYITSKELSEMEKLNKVFKRNDIESRILDDIQLHGLKQKTEIYNSMISRFLKGVLEIKKTTFYFEGTSTTSKYRRSPHLPQWIDREKGIYTAGRSGKLELFNTDLEVNVVITGKSKGCTKGYYSLIVVESKK